MSLLDDARELARISPFDRHITKSGAEVCGLCGRSDCAVRSIPRMVAVLEAADQVIDGDQFPGNDLIERLRRAMRG